MCKQVCRGSTAVCQREGRGQEGRGAASNNTPWLLPDDYECYNHCDVKAADQLLHSVRFLPKNAFIIVNTSRSHTVERNLYFIKVFSFFVLKLSLHFKDTLDTFTPQNPQHYLCYLLQSIHFNYVPVLNLMYYGKRVNKSITHKWHVVSFRTFSHFSYSSP